MIEYKGVTKIYDNDVVAVNDVDLQIQDGEFVCYIGTSGSGKTTALRLINRMNEITEGEIVIDGKSIEDMEAVDLRR